MVRMLLGAVSFLIELFLLSINFDSPSFGIPNYRYALVCTAFGRTDANKGRAAAPRDYEG